IGQAVGWWTVLYLLFWLVLFTVAAVESFPQPDSPLRLPLRQLTAGLLVVLSVAALTRSRVPPVRADRRDLLRLVLAPAPPITVLAWPFFKAHLLRLLGGLLVGLGWLLLAGTWLDTRAPLAPIGVPLLLLTLHSLRWL